MPNTNDPKRFIRNLRLTDEECIKLRKYAKACGTSQSGYLRNLLNGYEPKEKPSDEFYGELKKLYALLYKLDDASDNRDIKAVTDSVYELIYDIEKKYIKPDRK